MDLARAEALLSCKASASQLLQKQTHVKSLVVESDDQLLFHQEVSESGVYDGLLCTPEKDEVEENDDGSFTVWVLCKFDLSKAGEKTNPQAASDSRSTAPASLQAPNLTAIREQDVAVGQALQQSRQQFVLSIVSVPPCTNLLIRGKRPRTESCSKSPTDVVIYPEDESVLVRATGFMPKTIELQGGGGTGREAIQVILERP